MSRDWLSTLWPGSCDGLPFWVERDSENGGRRLKVNEFMGADDPFIQDLGRRAKPFSLTLYLASDTADADAAALGARFDAPGPHVLVLPYQGSISAHCANFARASGKERMGYVAFTVQVWRAGASGPVQTVLSLAQLAFDAADAVAAALAGLTNRLTLVGSPGWVASGVVMALENQTAALELLTVAQPVDPAQAPALASGLSAFYGSIPSLVSALSGVDPTVGPQLGALAAQFVPALPAGACVAAFAALADAATAVAANPAPGPFALAAQQAEAQNVTLLARLEQANAVQAYAQALLGMTFADRPSGVQARADALARIDAALALCDGGDDLALYDALLDLRATLAQWFAATIANLAPIVVVQVGASLPATVLAWSLYSDPSRAPELIARNGVPNPTFMPERFEALAS